MSEQSTTGCFSTTRWSLVLEAGAPAGLPGKEALATLCKLYWYPLYAYVRRRGHTADQAEDLTQGFFARLLEKNVVGDADPHRGRFRSYLLGAMKQFLSNERERSQAQKRGGGRASVSLSGAEDAERRYSHEPSHDSSPERLFDRQWALTVLDLAMAELRAEFGRRGKERLFERLKGCLAGEDPDLTYRQIAGELGMTEGAVGVAVHRMRRQYREALRQQIAQTVQSPAEIDDEIRQLFAAVHG